VSWGREHENTVFRLCHSCCNHAAPSPAFLHPASSCQKLGH
jgi:hypothetical protein